MTPRSGSNVTLSVPPDSHSGRFKVAGSSSTTARMVPGAPAACTRTGRLPRAGASESNARVTVGGGTFLPPALVVGAAGRARFRFGGRKIPGPRAHLEIFALHCHADAAETAVEFLVGRVITEQIVRAGVGEDLLHRARHVAGIEHGITVGLVGHHPQIIVALPQPGRVHRRRHAPVDRRVEHDQPARVDGIEADVGAVGALQQLAEVHVVIDIGQHRPQPIAGLVRAQRPSADPDSRTGAGRRSGIGAELVTGPAARQSRAKGARSADRAATLP